METFSIYGIAFNCPFLKRIKYCPFYEVDHLSFKEKFNLIEKLKTAKRSEILNYHILCSKEREKEITMNETSSNDIE